MNSEARYPVYLVGPAIKRLYPMWLIGGAAFAVLLLVNLYTLVRFGQASWLWTPLSLAVVASLTFGYLSSKRSATITTPEHIETRTLTKTRQTAWRDIQSIEVKGGAATGRRVFVTDAAGEEFRLPNLDSGSLESSFDDEVAALRTLWEQRRA
ncbi:PH domain-containing protein [Promicromonospora sp. Populi]|uniref:PH domain-containing protein n=1 Tax=Promicromonospora sp. Populi TaxID=3239420 RepID=UPI0034E1D80E